MWLFWLMLLAFGLFDPYVSNYLDQDAYVLTSSFIITACLFAWFIFDARESNYSPSKGLKIAVIAVGVLAIPYYVVKAKGFKRALISLATFLGFAIAYFAFFALADTINL